MDKVKASVLVVDDDSDILATAKVFLKQRFDRVQTEQDPSQIGARLKEHEYDAVLLDMNFKKGEQDGAAGLNALSEIVKQAPGTTVIMMTAYGEVNLAVEAMKDGAADFITKPWRNEKLFTTITNALKLKKSSEQLEGLKAMQRGNPAFSELIGSSPLMLQAIDLIRKVGPTEASILIKGENGTGKELAARAIHESSDRKDEIFVSVDLGALTGSLFESELFGHVKGAFTDAKADKVGRFELANGGTLFLDEVGNLPLPLQAKLLTVLQNRTIQRVGSSKSVPVDIRLICATNAPLPEMVSSGQFRQDLLYRINTIELEMPALRDREGDIPLLSNHFLSLYSKKYHRKGKVLDRHIIKHLEVYHWPGNVRELQQTIERAIILSDDQQIQLSDIGLPGSRMNEDDQNLDLKSNEKRLILKALEKNGGNVTHAAKSLGIDRLALYRRMEKYGI
ncbi:MAG: sigma-54 dependent transcriptional regulator [Cyclobacteriaceae bacterium]